MKSNLIISYIKNNYKSILIFVVCLFILYWMIFVLTPLSKMSEEARFEIRELNTKIESVEKQQEKIQTEIKKYEVKINETNDNIQKIKEIRIKVGNEYGKKIISVGSFTDDELTKFFTDRYSK